MNNKKLSVYEQWFQASPKQYLIMMFFVCFGSARIALDLLILFQWQPMIDLDFASVIYCYFLAVVCATASYGGIKRRLKNKVHKEGSSI